MRNQRICTASAVALLGVLTVSVKSTFNTIDDMHWPTSASVTIMDHALST